MTAVTLNPTGPSTLPPSTPLPAASKVGGATTATSPSTQTSPSSGTRTAAVSKQDFLQLIIAEMKNQDPMAPMDNTAQITQLAQFNTLEQMQQLNTTIESFTATQSIMEAASLLGKTVGYRASANTFDPLLSGQVSSVSWGTGTPKLKVDNKEVDLTQIVSVE